MHPTLIGSLDPSSIVSLLVGETSETMRALHSGRHVGGVVWLWSLGEPHRGQLREPSPSSARLLHDASSDLGDHTL